MPGENNIIGILKGSNCLPLEKLDKIERLASATPPSQLLDKLVACNLLSLETAQKLQEFLQALERNVSTSSTNPDSSIYTLSQEKKKDILFARQILTEGLCSIQQINQCFAEQASKTDKFLSLSQIMVRQRVIPVDKIVTLHREIEKKLKETDINQLLAKDKSFRVTIKDNAIYFWENSIPENFGPYRIIEEIARGGMGVVYKAWDPKLKRHIALKVLKAWENPPMEEIQRFHREARFAASLNHPNIVSIYDAGVVDSVHYFTMDYVEGKPLSKLLAEKTLSVRESLIIIRDIALALDYAHSRHVIHRDVKPGNIILDASNRPLLTDFGLAKAMNMKETGHLTKSGTALGTPAYMSPEQAQGTSTIDERSDIYSLGAVLYEMLTRRPPFTGESFGLVIADVISKEPVLPSKLNPDIHQDVEKICIKAMAKDRDQRYPDCKSLIEDIDLFLKGDRVQTARHIPSSLNFKKKIAKHPILVLLTGFFLLLSFAFIVLWLWKTRTEKIQSEALFLQGQSFLENKEYEKGLPLLWDASKNPKLHSKMLQLLQEKSAQHYQQGIKFLEQHKTKEEVFRNQYQKELIRFQQAKNWEEKVNSLQQIEELFQLRRKSQQELLLAVENFLYAFMCEPWNSDVHNYLLKIFLGHSMTKEAEAKNLPLSQLLPNFLSFQYGTLSIHTKPSDAMIYAFMLEEHYLKIVPVGWRWKNPRKQGDAQGSSMNFQEDTRNFMEYLHKFLLTNSEPIFNESSELGKSPIHKFPLISGNYLIVVVSEKYIPTPIIIKIRGDQETKVEVTLYPKTLLGENDWVNFVPMTLPHDKKRAYFLSKHEVSCGEYAEFLNDPQTIKRYKSLGSKHRYVPRDSNGNMLKEIVEQKGNQFFFFDEKKSVVGISWDDAREYCEWLTGKKGKQVQYTLPLFEVWQEFAGKQDERVYPWGNSFDKNFVLDLPQKKWALDVSPYGIWEMVSNVREWGESVTERQCMVYGGNTESLDSFYFQSSYRSLYPKNQTEKDIGFRVMAIMNLD